MGSPHVPVGPVAVVGAAAPVAGFAVGEVMIATAVGAAIVVGAVMVANAVEPAVVVVGVAVVGFAAAAIIVAAVGAARAAPVSARSYRRSRGRTLTPRSHALRYDLAPTPRSGNRLSARQSTHTGANLIKEARG